MAISPITRMLEKCSSGTCGNCESCRPDLVKTAMFAIRLQLLIIKPIKIRYLKISTWLLQLRSRYCMFFKTMKEL